MENRNQRSNSAETFRAPENTPVIPLPNPGEGGPVYPGGSGDSGNTPVVPLPNPGEGGPVYPGNSGYPSNPGYPNNPGYPSNPGYPQFGPGPAIPPGSAPYPNAPGGGIQLLPDSNFPNLTSRYAALRFLNATNGYAPFRILIDNTVATRLLDAGNATSYVRITSGTHTITVAGLDGYIYIQQRLRFGAGSVNTVAIVNRTGGLALRRITDNCPIC